MKVTGSKDLSELLHQDSLSSPFKVVTNLSVVKVDGCSCLDGASANDSGFEDTEIIAV